MSKHSQIEASITRRLCILIPLLLLILETQFFSKKGAVPHVVWHELKAACSQDTALFDMNINYSEPVHVGYIQQWENKRGEKC